MKKCNYLFEENQWNEDLDSSLDSQNTLIICFGSSDFDDIKDGIYDLTVNFPNSKIVGCSTSGEIFQDELLEKSLSVAIMKFEKTQIKLTTSNIPHASDSFLGAANIAKELKQDDLKGIFVLSDGLNINGSALAKGFNSVLSKDIVITGGLAGDGTAFSKTWVLVNNEPKEHYITAVGFYGENVLFNSSSFGGWTKFGINRMVTNSENNVLYSLDGKPALEVYKTYLGDNAASLPSSGLLFPLMIKEEGYSEAKVRTILAINEEDQSITFAGDIPNNSEVMFMRASFQDLVDGASTASTILEKDSFDLDNSVSIAISCVGRKLVLGQKTEDEIEAVLENLSQHTSQIGFYSYGEISPLSTKECDLHNQTMTLTLIGEKE